MGMARIASAVCIGGSMVAIGHLVAGAGTDSRSVAGAVAICLALAGGVFAFCEISYGGRAARSEERRIRAELLKRQYALASKPNSLRDTYSPSSVIQMVTDNTERLTEYRQVYFGATLAALAIPFLTLTYVGIFVDWVVGFGVMALVPLIPILIGGFMRFFRKTSAESRSQRSQLSGKYLDALRNLVTIRLLGAGGRIEHELSVQGEANRGAIMRLLAGNQIVIIIMDGLFALVLICLTAALTVARSDHMTSAQIVGVMLLTILLLEPLQQVAGFFYIGMGGIASQRALRSYLAATDEVDAATAGVTNDEPLPTASARSDLAIEMRGVRFDYGRGEVLHGIDLEVPIGSRVAIVGPSGAGKSTLLGLLRGSIPPQQGMIAVAGTVIDPGDAKTTRSLSATVAQSTWMFTGTIADNLRMARENATDAELWDALESAQVADEIARMPHGLDTYIGEGAALISGGQAQRISLARALLSGRSVLLLDEPTSQVDIESESKIIDAIASLPTDRTVLMITHRRSLLRIADRVHELTDGRLQSVEVAHV